MEWNSFGDWIENIFTLAGGAAGIFAVIVSIAQASGKKVVDYWFEKRNKKYQKEIDKEIEKYKSELDEKNREIQNQLDTKLELIRIEYGTLYQKRIKAIEDIYSWLFIFQNLTNEYPNRSYSSSGDEYEYEEDSRFISDIIMVSKQGCSLIGKNLIYFSDGDSGKLNELKTKVSLFINEYNEYSTCGNESVDNAYYPADPTDFLCRNKKHLKSNDIDDLVRNILSLFRELIGIKEGK